MQKSKGFTIIELIVVIAIIAVLAAIVLVNVTGYINKSKNAAIKGNMSTIMTNAATFFDSVTSYNGFTASAGFTVPEAAISSAGGAVIKTTATDNTAYCACSSLLTASDVPAGNTYCIDSTGAKKQTATACASECVAGVCQ